MEKKNQEAVVNAKDLPISTKHAVAICDLIRYKKPEEAIELLEKVLEKKLAVPMKGEIPHRRAGVRAGKGKVAGRFPVKASKIFIGLIKNLIANASVKGLDKDQLIISLAMANKASRPYRRTRLAYGRKRFKRTHVTLKASYKEKL